MKIIKINTALTLKSGIEIPSGAAGSIQFSDGSAFASNNANLFYDDTNNRLGVGINSGLTVIQVDANSCTFVATGGLTLRNRQSHTKSAGQYAGCSLLVSGTDLILTGDTRA